MNFSENFFNLIVNEASKENLFPDIFEKLEDEDILNSICSLGKAIKNFLGPPQLLACNDMERGISLFSVEKLLYFSLYGGLGGIAMENCPVGLGLCLCDKVELLGGLGLYGIFMGKEKAFISMGVTGYCYACLEGFLGFEGKNPYGEQYSGFLENGPYGIGLGSNIGAILGGYAYPSPSREARCNLPGALPGFFTV